ncbi:response regulator [Ligilactobacillus animalis]|uniref:response regulator n=1 Tax=Ligilactobacillus animalis TaxID=1605 RepID=UPI002943D603|nr:response regulator [Ligilactobacillus animalis]
MGVVLPLMDGFTLIEKLRQKGNIVPVLILTAKDSLANRVKGLDIGADDYLVRPFEFEELLARIRLRYRRSVTLVLR